MKRMLRWGVPTAMVVLLVLYAGISFLIAQGVTKAERKEQEDHPSEYDLDFEDVEFLSRRGDVTLQGWYMPSEAPGPVIIFVHGIGGIRTSDEFMTLAAMLAERGFSVLMFDLRAHGTSEGDKISGGLHERLDVLGAFDYLRGRGVPAARIGILGRSMGAGTSVLAAADEPAIEALVIDSSYAKASELVAQETARKTLFPEWFVPIFVPGADLAADLFFDIDLGKLNPEKAVAGLGYPVLVIHGQADTRIPVEHGVRIHLASHSDSELWLVPDVDHVDAFLTLPEAYAERVTAYFEERLGATPK